MNIRLLLGNGVKLKEALITSYEKRPDVVTFGGRSFMFSGQVLIKDTIHFIYKECFGLNIDNGLLIKE